jgi:hypothetical protein
MLDAARKAKQEKEKWDFLTICRRNLVITPNYITFAA